MSVLVLLLAAGGLVAGGFLGAFIWAVHTGQFDDTGTPPVRVLLDDTHADVPASSSPSSSRGLPDVEFRN
ncbi:MAG: cbb3-type cytochrome oxidase assembly protein CcoS [Acidobacteriota bacterium]